METGKRLDVALSFAGEQRDYVRAVADHLKKAGINLFYDEYAQEDMWGKSLAEELNSIYARGARFVVVFVSKEYLKKQWTVYERRTILSAYVKDPSIFLPVSMDGTLELPGFPSDTVMLQSKDYTPEKLALAIIRKVTENKNQVSQNGKMPKVERAGAPSQHKPHGFFANQILEEYEKKEAELVHKGRMEPAELHWNAVRSGQIKTIQQINDISPALVVNAYVSEPFKYDYHDDKYLYVLVKTIKNGYAKRLVRGKYYPAACTENIWPYYLLTLNTNTRELVEIEPPQVVTLFNENKRTDTMTAIEELFMKVKEKTGHPYELRNL